MKKSLLAVAAMTAFAGAAQAQSSVTVYGILDVGFVGGNTTAATTAANTTGAPGVIKTTGNQFGNSAEQTSRLGFKGTEDLGGGLSALFTAEFALAPTDTTLSGNPASTSSTGGASNGGLQNRQSFVGLKKVGVGTGAIGTQYTGIHNAVAATDPGQTNNMMGNVIYASGTGPATNSIGTAQGATTAYTVRLDNQLSFVSDKFAGFGVNAMYVLNNKNSNQYNLATLTAQAPTTNAVAAGTVQGGTVNTTAWGLGADYTGQYQSLKQFTTGAVAAPQAFNLAGAGLVTLTPVLAGSTAASGVAGTPITQGQNVTDNQGYVGATYDFGILKAYAQYVTRTVTAQSNSGIYIKRSAEQIGVRSFITPTIEAWGSAGLGRFNTLSTTASSAPTQNFNAWQLGSNYWLSKRTNLYAIYGATTSSNAALPSGAVISSSGQNYAVGVRHTF
jgi:predicted porin